VAGPLSRPILQAGPGGGGGGHEHDRDRHDTAARQPARGGRPRAGVGARRLGARPTALAAGGAGGVGGDPAAPCGGASRAGPSTAVQIRATPQAPAHLRAGEVLEAPLAGRPTAVTDKPMVIDGERRQDQGAAARARGRRRPALACHDRATDLRQHGRGVPGAGAQRRLRRVGRVRPEGRKGGQAVAAAASAASKTGCGHGACRRGHGRRERSFRADVPAGQWRR
jgi:hypothetical protein